MQTARPVLHAAAAVASADLVLDGHGYGHGIGLSQWGAYGYAVDFGWSAGRILDQYYGTTVADTVDVNALITVRLQALDDAQTAVVAGNGIASLTVDNVAGGPWTSLLARETTAGTYTVWGRTDAAVCPASTDVPGPATGWTQVATQTVVTFRDSTDATAGNDHSKLIALCEPAGTVRSYRGAVRAVNGSAGEKRTVNEVPVEQYLRAVIAKEMSPSWALAGGGNGLQALEAQTIAGRSYALVEHRYTYAMTCDQVCQTYPGAAVRHSLGSGFTSVEHPLSDPAVTATAGVVRRTASGAIATTMYSASTGGWTSPSSLGFTPQQDQGDATSLNPNHTWTVTIPGATVERAYPTIGTFIGLTVTARNGYGDWGGRVTTAILNGTAGSVTVTGDQVRTALGLKSNWFNVHGATTAGVDTVALGAGASAPAVRMVRG